MRKIDRPGFAATVVGLMGVLALAGAGIMCSSKKPASAPPGGDDDTFIPSGRQSHTFTSAADWAQGTADGVNWDSGGEVQMSANVSMYQTPYLWVPNSVDRTVSKIDTTTLQVVGTYPLVDGQGNDCWNPSRTTVDLDGNVWVGCRGGNSYINGPPDQALVPQTVDHRVVKLARDDGHVLLSVVVGYAPRGLAIDVNNHVWIGCSVDDTVWEIDGDTGACYRGDAAGCAAPAIAVADFPYGAAIDQRGHLWLPCLAIPLESHPLLTEVDTTTGTVLGIYGPYDRNGVIQLYGIAIDQLNDIWLGGFGGNDVVKVKGVAGVNPTDGQTYAAGQMIGAYMSGGTASRGVAVDLDGNVWVAMSGTSTAVKINGQSGAIMATVNVGSGPIGVGVDAYGNAWTVNQGGNSVHRINGLDTSVKVEIPVGNGPYSYSDMLGMALRTITHRNEGFASWNVVVDSGVENPAWESVHWTANTPAGTSIKARTRCAVSTDALANAPWSPFLSAPGYMSCAGSAGRYAEVEVRFSSTTPGLSPVLQDLTVYWST